MTQPKAFDQIKVSDEQEKQGSYTIDDNNNAKLWKLRGSDSELDWSKYLVSKYREEINLRERQHKKTL